MKYIVLNLYRGQPSFLIHKPEIFTAINKAEVDLLTVFFDRIDGDGVANQIHHGGSKRVIHHFPSEHYEFFREVYSGNEFREGSMGENLSTRGIDESNVCIGDVYEIGNVRLAVTEPRKPCATINHQFGIDGLARLTQEKSKTGWFYQVLSEGLIRRGQELVLLERPFPQLTVESCIQALLVTSDKKVLSLISSNPVISESWRRPAQDYLKTGIKPDDRERLGD
ncbi:MAG: MOSC domain-containing protein [Bdellovibrionales bacterium]|nr:MOSC domain-containing protein [Bdellovibrionales bacterium]